MSRSLLLCALAAALLLAGCAATPDEAGPPADDTLNNAPGPSDDPGANVEEDECISTTTGEPTDDPAANPCPQGQYPSG